MCRNRLIKGLNRDGEENRAIKIDYLFLKRFKKSNVHYKMEKTMFAYSWHQTDDETKNWSKSKESLRIYGITDDGRRLMTYGDDVWIGN